MSTILTERRGPILLITIDRQDVRNAVDRATAGALEAAADLLDSDDSLFVGVLTGAGGTFCAGADLKAAARGERAITDRRGGFGFFAQPPRKPVIAAVEGYAVGGGFELCLACDLIVAARDARFGLPEVRHNLVASGGGLIRLPRRMPYHLAMEVALDGQPRSAQFFHRAGVVNRLAEPGQALSVAIAWAEGLLVNGPTALAATKQIVSRALDWTEAEAWESQAPFVKSVRDSEDRKEGLAAFAEGRKPVWRGR
ncbi:crotonase/enoyl-CoA hydratase family protein [Bradyrhizobium sp. Pear76]|uniref:crotonase/enoyl-CoA hydratase family protein n=1 Tax=Bradyrhizobium oropedii TaxID=1571201 RepID=UPI001E34BC52|nr:crotonase/enoyl-CoA hydratase family protein [Bradyrhizobium oropedii]MCC8967090.1 crotonase/enoyl-CoA hydratase family protein [Bradyrhizobium oropedii]